MVKKKVEKKSYDKKSLGISGFILGIISLSIIPLFLLMIFLGPWTIGIITGIVGFVFCLIQQKKKKTRLGKIGIILNLIGVLISTASLMVIIKYILPIIQEQMQNFPAI